MQFYKPNHNLMFTLGIEMLCSWLNDALCNYNFPTMTSESDFLLTLWLWCSQSFAHSPLHSVVMPNKANVDMTPLSILLNQDWGHLGKKDCVSHKVKANHILMVPTFHIGFDGCTQTQQHNSPIMPNQPNPTDSTAHLLSNTTLPHATADQMYVPNTLRQVCQQIKKPFMEWFLLALSMPSGGSITFRLPAEYQSLEL